VIALKNAAVIEGDVAEHMASHHDPYFLHGVALAAAGARHQVADAHGTISHGNQAHHALQHAVRIPCGRLEIRGQTSPCSRRTTCQTAAP
jgi:hypothetical protein